MFGFYEVGGEGVDLYGGGEYFGVGFCDVEDCVFCSCVLWGVG